MLVLIGVAAFRAAFLPHTAKPSVASKLAQTNHPVAVPPPQWLPVLLAANTPGPPNHRRLGEVTLITTEATLRTAVGEYNANVTAAEDTYGPIEAWDVLGITDMSELFKDLVNFNADISSWNTSGVTACAPCSMCVPSPRPPQPRALPCMLLAPEFRVQSL